MTNSVSICEHEVPQISTCEPIGASSIAEAGAGVGNHPECGSHAAAGAEIKIASGWGGRRAGAGRKPNTPAVDSRTLGARWYLVQTLPRQELRAIMFLTLAGFTVRCPLYIDNDRSVPSPRFPGYLFVQFDPGHDDWRVISEDMPGVVCLYRSTEGRPVPFPPAVAEEWIRDAAGVRDDTRRDPLLAPGTLLRVADGPFTSFPAIVEWSEGHRVGVLVEIFGRTTKVELRRNQLDLA